MDSKVDLERKAAAGDAQAQFDLGRLLLNVPGSAVDGLRGVTLIDHASRAANADAMAMSALFHAMGVGRVPNWDRALDGLQAAAEAGSQHAREQITLLSGQETKRLAGDSPDGLWRELRERIDVQSLLRADDITILSESPRIRIIKGFATPAECEWLIARAGERLRRAAVVDKETGKLTFAVERSNSSVEFQLTDMDVVLEILRARISAATRLPLPVFEPTQVLHYAPGQEFRPHYDFLDPDNPAYREQLSFGQRIATFLIYLNESFEGGETEFPKASIEYRGKVGDAIFFANVDRQGRPDPLTLHAGRPTSVGDKWLLSQWIRDRAGASR